MYTKHKQESLYYMTDPILTPIMGKVLSGTGGFVGGATFMAFYRPKNVWDAAIRSSVSTASAIIGAIPLIEYYNIPMSMDNIILSGAVIGFCAWSLLTLAARMLLKIQDEKTEIKLPEFIKTKQ
jgi:hypothetical protein